MILRVIALLCFAFVFSACTKEVETGPGKIRLDREICARCAMGISDMNSAAQIRGGRIDRPAKLYKFDDFGCAVLWIDEQPWKDNEGVEFWVSERGTDGWINAKDAFYVRGNRTPMEYGLMAQKNTEEGALDFSKARDFIYQEEKRLNLHFGLPHPTPPSYPVTPTE